MKIITETEARLVVITLRKIVGRQDLNGVVYWGVGIWEEIIRVMNCISIKENTPDIFGKLGYKDESLAPNAIYIKQNDKKQDLLFNSYQDIIDYNINI
jgi:hypothetical protein